MVQQFSPQRIDRDDVWQLIPKIEAHHEPEFDKSGSAARHTRLKVRLKDGSTRQHFVEAARTTASPLTNQEIEAKYLTLTDGIIDAGRQAAIAESILAVEKMKSTADLTRLLGPSVGAPFE
jgi:2-methylcitrate dehydratase PrpD